MYQLHLQLLSFLSYRREGQIHYLLVLQAKHRHKAVLLNPLHHPEDTRIPFDMTICFKPPVPTAKLHRANPAAELSPQTRSHGCCSRSTCGPSRRWVRCILGTSPLPSPLRTAAKLSKTQLQVQHTCTHLRDNEGMSVFAVVEVAPMCCRAA